VANKAIRVLSAAFSYGRAAVTQQVLLAQGVADPPPFLARLTRADGEAIDAKVETLELLCELCAR
jgi:hypothetical protein